MRKKSNFVVGETTVIGAGTIIEGNMKASASARIDGEINGDIASDGTIIVGVEGKVKGNIVATDVTIAGSVSGNVTVTGKIELAAKGQLIGDIKTGTLVIDENAVFQGKCTMKEETVQEPAPVNTEDTDSKEDVAE